MKASLKKSKPMAEAIAALLHPFAEVVIHDLESDRVAAIFNPFSARAVGDPSYLDTLKGMEETNSPVIGPYEKISHDGRRLKSISVILTGENSKAEGFLCINMDISVFATFQNHLAGFLQTTLGAQSLQTAPLFKNDIYEEINAFIRHYCTQRGLDFANLSRSDKKALVRLLRQRGAFTAKNAPAYIARILNMSRASVYNYLKHSEQKEFAAD